MEQEVERLKTIYKEDLSINNGDNGSATVSVKIRIGKVDRNSEECFSALFTANCSPNYPNEQPEVELSELCNVPDEAANNLRQKLTELTNDNKDKRPLLLLTRVVKRALLDLRVHECPVCREELSGGIAGPDSVNWRSHCGHHFHRKCILKLIEEARVKAEREAEEKKEAENEDGEGEEKEGDGDGDQQAERKKQKPQRAACPACSVYEFDLRDDKPISRRVKSAGGGGGQRRRRHQRPRGERHSPADGDAQEAVEGDEETGGGGDQRRRRRQQQQQQRVFRRRRGNNSQSGVPASNGETGEAGGGGGGSEKENAPGAGGNSRRRRKNRRNRRRDGEPEEDEEAEGEGENDAEYYEEAEGDDPRAFNRRRQADKRFSRFEQLRSRVQPRQPMPGFVDERGGFYAPDGFYYYDGPDAFYQMMEEVGAGQAYGRRGGGGGGGRRGRNRRRQRSAGQKEAEGGGAGEGDVAVGEGRDDGGDN